MLKCTAEIRNGVSFFRMKESHDISLVEPKGKEIQGKRGKIKDFSRKARNRLGQFLFSLPTIASFFATLTYAKFYPADSKEWKRHLHLLQLALNAKFGNSYHIWKLEAQRRGAPHYHILIWTDKKCSLTYLRRWIRKRWCEIVNYTPGTSMRKNHEGQGTDVARVVSPKQMSRYIMKYFAKEEINLEAWACPGRFWGVGNKKNFPLVTEKIFELNGNDYLTLKRIIRRWMKRFSPNYARRVGQMYSFFAYVSSKMVEDIIWKLLKPINFQVHQFNFEQYLIALRGPAIQYERIDRNTGEVLPYVS